MLVMMVLFVYAALILMAEFISMPMLLVVMVPVEI
jgi:hypothetical protein